MNNKLNLNVVKVIVFLLVFLSVIGINISKNTVMAATTDIALNKSVTSDSQQTSKKNTADKINDGDKTSRWCAADGKENHWIKVDLGNSSEITGAQIMWEKSNIVYKYKIETSNDDSNWTVKVDNTKNTSTTQIQTNDFKGTARYVKLTVTGLTGVWASIYDFKVFGTNGSSTVDKHTVYIAGDSTVMTYGSKFAPQAGWGQFIANYFTKNVNFENHAIGGRSSKSFVDEGRLNEILNKIKANDYLFIQLGHNDTKKDDPKRYTDPNTTYKQYLKMYIDGARKKNAIPVLITPVGRNHYVNGAFKNDFPAYCNAMKQLAKEENVQIIDLMSKSLNYFNSIGYDETYKLFMVSSNGTDYTHFTQKGADKIAKLVSEGVKEIKVPISKDIK